MIIGKTYGHLLIQRLNILPQLRLQRNHAVLEHVVIPEYKKLLQQLWVVVCDIIYLSRISFEIVQLPLLGTLRLGDEDGFPVPSADSATTEEFPTLDKFFLVDPISGALLMLANY